MTAWVFDVDGVLCNTNEIATHEFCDWFKSWSKDKNYYLVTGGLRENTIAQMGTDIVCDSLITFNCLGNSVWQNGQQTLINQFILTPDEQNWLEEQVASSKFKFKTGRHINMRFGSMNFSTIGRNATMAERIQYRNWDTHHQERATIARNFVTLFPRFEAYLGGDISIDICLKGANKGQCVNIIRSHANDHIFFFGDKCHPGGIDEPFAKQCSQELGDKIFHVSGYQETWNILKGMK